MRYVVLSVLPALLIFGFLVCFNARKERANVSPIPKLQQILLLLLIECVIILPVVVISTMPVLVVLKIFGAYHGTLVFQSHISLFLAALYLLFGFIFVDHIGKPFVRFALLYIMRKSPSPLLDTLSSLVGVTILIYGISSLIPGIALNGVLGALSMSFLFHLPDWLYACAKFISKRFRSHPQDPP